ncbi:glycosyltransferase family 2 protein [Candidatus Collinsella stercoripullorum]|uniref:glycosyltransferase family 2 protein n=1 Tax=Candidatus Collinsella stercoripullorum TaxID=2838522 RepID=UPI0022E5A5B0|nr:glycosyltransferase family 2 protein [Candidatus Collinsella stercoripullorum]
MSDAPEDILVSVIVPTFRRADRLPAALDSVLAQDYRNLEVVVANDNMPGSEWDGRTDALLARYGSTDPRVRIVHTVGGTGGGAARNLACAAARGEYLAFLDDDDEFLPDKVSTQLAFMLERDLDMSWQDVSWFDERGRLVEHRRLDHCRDFSREGLLRAHLLTPISPTSIYMLKRSLFERTEGFGEVATGQDWWLMLRCIEAGASIGYMPEVHVRQHLHSDGRLSVGQNKIDGEEARHEKVREYYPLLTREEISYVEFRHNAALAFACVRGGRRADAVRYAARALRASPSACVREGFKFFTRGKR